jgi:hypothetical protein
MASSTCWYCNRTLGLNDIVSAGGSATTADDQDHVVSMPPETATMQSSGTEKGTMGRLLGTLRKSVLQNKRGWALLLGLVAFWLLVAESVREEENAKNQKAAAFAAMSPGDHLVSARIDLRAHLYQSALSHLKEIPPNAPEAGDATLVEQEVRSAQQEEAAARAVEAAAQAAWENAIRNVENNLKSLGYSVAVSHSNVRDELVMTSSDFGDTDHRVKFLSFLRSRRSPAFEACFVGYRKVRLKAGTPFGFDEVYSLECSN